MFPVEILLISAHTKNILFDSLRHRGKNTRRRDRVRGGEEKTCGNPEDIKKEGAPCEGAVPAVRGGPQERGVAAGGLRQVEREGEGLQETAAGTGGTVAAEPEPSETIPARAGGGRGEGRQCRRQPEYDSSKAQKFRHHQHNSRYVFFRILERRCSQFEFRFLD